MSSFYLSMAVLLCASAGTDNVQLETACPELFLCAPKAVYLLLRLTGHNQQFSEVVKNTKMSSRGASLLWVKNELENNGLPADIVKCTSAELRQLPTPYIMYIYPPKRQGDIGHFVVVVAITDKTLQVLDANTGVEKTYQLTKLANIWDGTLIVPRAPRLDLIDAVALFALCTVAVLIYRSKRRRHGLSPHPLPAYV